MPLDGLRAWVAEVERKLGKRTRVFLALCVISIGIAGAAVYLAIDARNSSVSESDVQELQRELEARIDEGATTAPGLGTTPESTTPEESPATPPGSGGSGAGGSGSGSKSGSGGNSSSNGGAGNAGKLEDLLEEARKQAE